MSAVGTTLLQSPGWNEGKARNETLGTHRKKKMSSVGAALQSKHLPYVSEVSPLQGSSTFSQSIYFIILVRLLCVFVWGVSLKS